MRTGKSGREGSAFLRHLLLLGKETLFLAALVFAVTSLPFFLAKISFHDVSALFVGFQAPDSVRLRWLQAHGLDGPVLEQFANYLKMLFQGNLGRSYIYNVEVMDLIAGRWRPTFLMTAIGSILGILAGYVLASAFFLMEQRSPKTAGSLSRLLVVGYIPVPIFLYLFREAMIAIGWPDLSVRSSSLPFILTGGVALAILPMTLTVSAILPAIREELGSYHALAARVAGIRTSSYLLRFGSKGFLLRGLGLIRPSIIYCLSFSFFPELSLGMEGLGVLSVDAAMKGDLPLLSACALLPLCVLIVCARAIRVLEIWLDPREEKT